MSPIKVQAALRYAEAYVDEVTAAISEFEESNFESLRRMLPNIEVFPSPKRS